MNNEFDGFYRSHLDFLFRGSDVAMIVGVVLSVLALAVAMYVHFKVARMTRRDHEIGKKFVIKITPWRVEAQRTYVKHKFGMSGEESREGL